MPNTQHSHASEIAAPQTQQRTRPPGVPWLRIAVIVGALWVGTLGAACATPANATQVQTKRKAPGLVVISARPRTARRVAIGYRPASRCVRKPHRWVCRVR